MAEELVPLEDVVLEGTLGGGDGALSGWCGRDEGPEDVYVLRATNNRDIRIDIDPVGPNGFVPTVRFEVDTCGSTEAVTDDGYTALCEAGGVGITRFVHTEAGRVYTLTIDAPAGSGGDYRVTLTHERPPVGACPVHSNSPLLVSGGYFLWSNVLGSGQGRMDGLCGGPGQENMFAVVVAEPGVLRARVTATDGTSTPIVDVRTGCGFVTSQDCDQGAAGGSAEVQISVTEPGTYYVTADHHGVGTFAYDLEIWLN